MTKQGKKAQSGADGITHSAVTVLELSESYSQHNAEQVRIEVEARANAGWDLKSSFVHDSKLYLIFSKVCIARSSLPAAFIR